MSLTRLKDIEVAADRQFRNRRPAEDDLIEFIHQQIPRMNAAAAIEIAIGLGQLALQTWQFFKSNKEKKRAPFEIYCPTCRSDEITITKSGKIKCVNGHVWQLKRRR